MMTSIINVLLPYLLLYRYPALSVLTFFSGLALPLPENTLLLAVGAFASQGYFNLILSFVLGITCNVLGDLTGYTVTRVWGHKYVKERYIARFSSVARLDRYVKENAGVTILLTRFVGGVAPLVNLLSGLAGVSFGRFIIFDILGNMLDIGFFLGLGYVLGTVWQSFSSITNLISWIFLVSILIFALVKIFGKKKTV